MSDDRELVERLATIEATPRARWVAELRADLDAAWETEDLGDLDSRRRTTVTLVDNEPPPSEPSSGRRWTSLVVAAAAVVVVVVGVFVVFRGDDGTPADQPSPTVTVPFASPPRALPNTVTSRSCRGRTSSMRSTERRRRGSSSPSAPGGRPSSTGGPRQGRAR